MNSRSLVLEEDRVCSVSYQRTINCTLFEDAQSKQKRPSYDVQIKRACILLEVYIKSNALTRQKRIVARSLICGLDGQDYLELKCK